MNELQIEVKPMDGKNLTWFGKAVIIFLIFGLFYGLLDLINIVKPNILIHLLWIIGCIGLCSGFYYKKQKIWLKREGDQVYIGNYIYDIHNIYCLQTGNILQFRTRPYNWAQDIQFTYKTKDFPQIEAFIKDCLEIPIIIAHHDPEP